MKMYTCEKAFKTTFFNNGSVERIEVEKDSLWFLARAETQDRVVLSNNKIELNFRGDEQWEWMNTCWPV